MDSTISGVEDLQNAGVVDGESEVTAVLDAVMDREDVSVGVYPSTAPVELQVNTVQCWLCCSVGFLCEGHCPFCCKGELG